MNRRHGLLQAGQGVRHLRDAWDNFVESREYRDTMRVLRNRNCVTLDREFDLAALHTTLVAENRDSYLDQEENGWLIRRPRDELLEKIVACQKIEEDLEAGIAQCKARIASSRGKAHETLHDGLAEIAHGLRIYLIPQIR